MASLKAITTNFIESATLLNGGGGGAPALSEVSPYTLAQTKKRSRRSLWQIAATAAYNVDWDLGSDKTVDAAGPGAHAGISGAGITDFVVRIATNAQGYNPAAWAGSDATGTVTMSSARDKVTDFSAQGTARYVRFSLTTIATVFTLGKFVIGTYDVDLGLLFSSRQRLKRSPHFEDRTVTEDPIHNFTGYDREIWTLGWDNIPQATFNKLETLRALRRSFWLADERDVFREFVVSGLSMQDSTAIVLSGDTIYNPVTLELEQLG